MQDPVSSRVAAAISMSTEDANTRLTVASRRAAQVLRANGFVRAYCHHTWDRGMRWWKPADTQAPLPNRCATTILGSQLTAGNIAILYSDITRLN